jgi:hypothetical protein
MTHRPTEKQKNKKGIYIYVYVKKCIYTPCLAKVKNYPCTMVKHNAAVAEEDCLGVCPDAECTNTNRMPLKKRRVRQLDDAAKAAMSSSANYVYANYLPNKNIDNNENIPVPCPLKRLKRQVASCWAYDLVPSKNGNRATAAAAAAVNWTAILESSMPTSGPYWYTEDDARVSTNGGKNSLKGNGDVTRKTLADLSCMYQESLIETPPPLTRNPENTARLSHESVVSKNTINYQQELMRLFDTLEESDYEREIQAAALGWTNNTSTDTRNVTNVTPSPCPTSSNNATTFTATDFSKTTTLPVVFDAKKHKKVGCRTAMPYRPTPTKPHASALDNTRGTKWENPFPLYATTDALSAVAKRGLHVPSTFDKGTNILLLYSPMQEKEEVAEKASAFLPTLKLPFN